MFDGNIYALISLILGAIAVGTITFYIIPRQFNQVLRPHDWLTNLRWQILCAEIFIVMMSFPSLVYQGMRYSGLDSEILRNVASITSRLSFLGLTIVLVLWYNYKRKD